jgi:hypothetical protein
VAGGVGLMIAMPVGVEEWSAAVVLIVRAPHFVVLVPPALSPASVNSNSITELGTVLITCLVPWGSSVMAFIVAAAQSARNSLGVTT